MVDFANVHAMGRVVADPKVYNENDDRKSTRLTLDLAINLPIRTKGEYTTKAIFRRLVFWGALADYVWKCHQNDPQGLRGRLLVISGTMDTESYPHPESGKQVNQQIIRVANPGGIVNVMDRRDSSRADLND